MKLEKHNIGSFTFINNIYRCYLSWKKKFPSLPIELLTLKTKGEPWNSIMKAAAIKYRQVPKTTANALPPPPSPISYDN